MADLEELETRLTEALQRIASSQAMARAAMSETVQQITALTEENAALEAQLAQVAQQPSQPADSTEIAALQEALDAEREERRAQAEALSAAISEQALLVESRDDAEAAREEFAERARRLAERETLRAAEARAEMDALRDKIDALEAAADKLREANRQLRSNNAALRDAHATGVADHSLINAGLQAELDAMTAVRAADRAELDSVLDALRPMLEEASNA